MTLREAVFAACKNAVENGYDEFVVNAPLIAVAEDLLSNDADVERTEASMEEVAEQVEAWRDSRKPVKIMLDGRCGCSCADTCPLGRCGSLERCTEAELVAAGITIVK